MPLFDLRCDNGHEFERYLKFAELDFDQICECGRPAIRLIRPPMVFVQPNICYDSPITGQPITSKQKRDEDLARHGCIPYEEGMKQDHHQRLKDSERHLDKSVDEYVDRAIAQMPARKKEKLVAELEGGMTADVARITPPQISAPRTTEGA